jgi:predicted ATPase
VGRVAERAALGDLLASHRLVNVVGSGGVGKTRLALELAGDRIDEYPDGVWFTDLASVTDPALVPVAISATLGLRPEPGRAVVDTLREFTADRHCLLVLDTCDSQPSAAAMVVSRVLGSGATAKVLATSREPLNLPGEVVWRIPPMSLEPGAHGEPSDAVTLLHERISASRGGRPTPAGELRHLDRVAHQLDGLPLALELAAARLRNMSAGELASRLDGAADALDIGLSTATGGDPSDRHATIQATVSWSYRTLNPDAAQLLRYMSVFAGRVDESAIGWLTGGDPMTPLMVLVEKSLVTAEPGTDGTTYRMLDPIRGYAARKLADAGEDVLAHQQHIAWARYEIERRQQGVDGRSATVSMYAIDPLADEIRAALRWSMMHGSARDGLALASGLDQWWRERGLAREGRLWLFRVYERTAATGEMIPEVELAAAYHMHARHAGADGEPAEALRFADRAEAAARRTNDVGMLARVRAGRAIPLLDMGDSAAAEKACRDVLAWAASAGVTHEAIEAVYCLAQLLWRRGALDEAAELLASARPVEAARPDERGRRMIDMILGMVALSRGDLVAAHEHLIVALRSRMTFGFHSGACESLNALAARCALGGDQITAARLFGAAQTAQAQLRGANLLWTPFWQEQQTRIRAALGDHAFDDAYGQGTALSLDEAVAVALSIDHPDLAAGSDRFVSLTG